MKRIYKHLSVWFAILIIFSSCLFIYDFFPPAQATAGYSKSINGIAFPLSGSDLTNAQNGTGTGGSQCWGFATWIYKRLFGMDHLPYTYNNNHFVTSYGSTIPTTADNLKTWVLRAGPGAVLRVCNSSSPTWDSDGGSGHSLVIIDANESGAWTYQSGSASKVFVYDTSVSTSYAQYRNEVQFNTWSEMSKMLTSGPATSNGQYIKYILCPPGNRGFNTDPASNFRFRDVTYPKTYKIDTTNGWSLGSGIVESNYTLTSVRSEILNSSGGAVSDSGTKSISGYSYSIKAFDDYSGTNNGVRFSWISSAGNYTWRLTATDSSGRTLVMDMPVSASNSESTVTATMSKEYPLDQYLDLNGLLDGANSGDISGYGTADVYINGSRVADDVADYYDKWPKGTRYEIKDIKATAGHIYNGSSGNLTGSIDASTVQVVLNFSTIKVTGITLNQNGLTLVPNQTAALRATVSPSNAANKSVAWSSSNTSVATVSGGTVKAVGVGSATITCTAADGSGVKATCKVTVSAPEIKLPKGLKEIGEEAFAGIDASRVRVPDGVKTIGKRAFANCTKLEQIYIPETTTYIASDAFTNVPSSLVIRGKANSYAQTYATNKGYRFVADTGNEWSEWVTEDQLPSGTIEKESKQQYRYQDKVYSAWSDWGPRTENRESTGELKKEQQITEHYWYYDLCQNCGRHSPYTVCWDCGHSIGANWRVTWLDTSRSEGGQFGDSDKIFTMTDEGRWFYWTDDNGNGDSRTVYQYATRTYSWSNWSGWSDTYAASSSTRNVEVRTVYRYRFP